MAGTPFTGAPPLHRRSPAVAGALQPISAPHKPGKGLPLPCARSTTLLLVNPSPRAAQREHASEICHAEPPLPSHLSFRASPNSVEASDQSHVML